VAELAYLFERDAPGRVFGSFGDAVLWSLSVVLAGQGDPVPASIGGRITMIACLRHGGDRLAGRSDRRLSGRRAARARGEGAVSAAAR